MGRTSKAPKDAQFVRVNVDVRVVALEKLDESNHSLVEDKIPGISVLNNYKFVGTKLIAWRAYGIGSGNVIMKGLKTGNIKVACKSKLSPRSFILIFAPYRLQLSMAPRAVLFRRLQNNGTEN